MQTQCMARNAFVAVRDVRVGAQVALLRLEPSLRLDSGEDWIAATEVERT